MVESEVKKMATAKIEGKITVDMLTNDSVSILTERFYKGEKLGDNIRKAYINSPYGREELQKEVAEPYYSAIIAVWGDKATLEDIDLKKKEG